MANKKITELEQMDRYLYDDDLLLVETSDEGTRSITYENFIELTNIKINDASKPHPFANNAAAHNCIFRGKNLGTFDFHDNIINSLILDKIRDGSFKDLYIGDYFYVNVERYDGDYKQLKCKIAGFNTYYNPFIGYSIGNIDYNARFANKYNHAVIVAEYIDETPIHSILESEGIQNVIYTNLYSRLYDDSDNNNISYNISSLLQSTFNNSILKHRTSFPIGYDTVLKNYYFGNLNTYINLLSETQIFGTSIFHHLSSDYQNTQLPLFALDPTAKIIRDSGNIIDGEINGYWLRNTYEKDSFVYVTNEGIMDKSNYTESFGICPFFCIG